MIKNCNNCDKAISRSPSQFLNRQGEECPVFCSKECQAVWVFWSQVDKLTPAGPNKDCWEWTGQFSKNGYGQRTKKKSYTHRFAYEISFGTPKNLVLHKCNNKKCCNPPHLYDGTAKDNARDAIAAGVKFSFSRNNRPEIKKIEFQGEIRSQGSWERHLGLTRGALYNRFKRGLTVEQALMG